MSSATGIFFPSGVKLAAAIITQRNKDVKFDEQNFVFHSCLAKCLFLNICSTVYFELQGKILYEVKIIENVHSLVNLTNDFVPNTQTCKLFSRCV